VADVADGWMSESCLSARSSTEVTLEKLIQTPTAGGKYHALILQRTLSQGRLKHFWWISSAKQVLGEKYEIGVPLTKAVRYIGGR